MDGRNRHQSMDLIKLGVSYSFFLCSIGFFLFVYIDGSIIFRLMDYIEVKPGWKRLQPRDMLMLFFYYQYIIEM